MDIFNVKYWERKFVDLWSIVHFKTGVVYAFLPFGLNLPFYQAFIMLFIIAGVWEYAEILKIPKEIRETAINKLTDIGVALVGLWLVYTFMPPYEDDPTRYLTIAIPITIVYLVLAYIAWNAYGRYSGGPEKKKAKKK